MNTYVEIVGICILSQTMVDEEITSKDRVLYSHAY